MPRRDDFAGNTVDDDEASGTRMTIDVTREDVNEEDSADNAEDEELVLAKQRARDMNSYLPPDETDEADRGFEDEYDDDEKVMSIMKQSRKKKKEEEEAARPGAVAISGSGTLKTQNNLDSHGVDIDTDMRNAKIVAMNMGSILPPDIDSESDIADEEAGRHATNGIRVHTEGEAGDINSAVPGAQAVEGITSPSERRFDLSRRTSDYLVTSSSYDSIDDFANASKRKLLGEYNEEEDVSRAIKVEAKLVDENGEIDPADREKIADEVREELIRTTTFVVGEELEEEDPIKRRNRRIIFLCCVLGVCAAALLIGLMVGRKNRGELPDLTELPTISARPTDAPTTTFSPTTAPSFQPSTFPSMQPSISIENLNNSLREEAHPLILRSRKPSLQYNLQNASFQELTTSTCFRRRARRDLSKMWQLRQIQRDVKYKQLGHNRSLAIFAYPALGLWYTYKASRTGMVHIEVCNSDFWQLTDTTTTSPQSVNVTSPTNDSAVFIEAIHVESITASISLNGDLSNCQQNDDVISAFGIDTNSGFGANFPNKCNGVSMPIVVEKDQDYDILVSSPDVIPVFEGGMINGTFVIDAPYTISIVDNDDCFYAYGPIRPSFLGTIISYTTEFSTNDTLVGGDATGTSCFGSTKSTSPGAWYKVLGTGTRLLAQTCSSSTSGGTTTVESNTNENIFETTFNTQISVYRSLGDGCSDLRCVAGNNDINPNDNDVCGAVFGDDGDNILSKVEWSSVEGEMYYILVHGSGNDQGDFVLRINAVEEFQENDFCWDAMPLLVSPTMDDDNNETISAEDTLTTTVTVQYAGSTFKTELLFCNYTDKTYQPFGDEVLADANSINSKDYRHGLWYTVDGRDNVDIAIDFEFEYRVDRSSQEILVYSSGGDCGSLSCLNSTEISYFTIPVLWQVIGGTSVHFSSHCLHNTTVGKKYFIFVGTNHINGVEQQATVTVRSNGCMDPPMLIESDLVQPIPPDFDDGGSLVRIENDCATYLDPQVTENEDAASQVQMEIYFDFWATETSYEIKTNSTEANSTVVVCRPKDYYGTELSTMTARESFYLLPGFYTLHFYDSAGDGMGFGGGLANYTLSVMAAGSDNPNVVVTSIGDFGFVETTSFEVPETIT